MSSALVPVCRNSSVQSRLSVSSTPPLKTPHAPNTLYPTPTSALQQQEASQTHGSKALFTSPGAAPTTLLLISGWHLHVPRCSEQTPRDTPGSSPSHSPRRLPLQILSPWLSRVCGVEPPPALPCLLRATSIFAGILAPPSTSILTACCPHPDGVPRPGSPSPPPGPGGVVSLLCSDLLVGSSFSQGKRLP